MEYVELTQYLRPYGKREKVYAEVDDELAKRAKEANLVLSCEVLTTGHVAIYGRLPYQYEEEEIMEISPNAPGRYTPTQALETIIRKLTGGD